MSVYSPVSSPTTHVSQWSEHQVSDWLSATGLPKLGKDFVSNGITGDVLLLLDDDALKDIGVSTIGQRLAIHSGIYKLKSQYGVPLQDGDWVPKSVATHDATPLQSPQINSALRQRDDRIRILESQMMRLTDYLSRFQLDMANLSRHVGVKTQSTDSPISLVSSSYHDGSRNSLSGPASDPMFNLPLDSPTSRSFGGLISPSRAAFASAYNGRQQGTSRYGEHSYDDVASPANGLGLAPGGHSYSHSASGFKPAMAVRNEGAIAGTQSHSNISSPLMSGELSPTQSGPPFSAYAPTATAISPTRRLAHQHHLSTSDQNGVLRARSGSVSGTSPSPVAVSPSTPVPAPLSSSSAREQTSKGTAAVGAGSTSSIPSSSASSSENNPYKSFRVTLDDPCHKVLPAALKKYKINDDWRKYALFICYGKTERCLSYDEKPLLLFQKLKENEQNPVFMLRHIRDVKSPIAIAEVKAEAKMQERAKNPTSKKSPAPRSDGRKVALIAPPPGTVVANAAQPVELGPAADIPERIRQVKSYAVAIYPYMPERDDEFDVNVGDTFVVINKARGWWIVLRDRYGDGTGDVGYSIPTGEDEASDSALSYRAETVSGWVPAGCLLETNRPLNNIADPGSTLTLQVANSPSTSAPRTPTVPSSAAASERTKDVNRTSIPPAAIMSTSTPGIMLMDYQSAEADLDLKKDERLRVFKRYNHWSYCVQEREGHARGWVPSWYIGKLYTSSSSSTAAASSKTPTSANTSVDSRFTAAGSTSDTAPAKPSPSTAGPTDALSP